jgi:hypothetical protein
MAFPLSHTQHEERKDSRCLEYRHEAAQHAHSVRCQVRCAHTAHAPTQRSASLVYVVLGGKGQLRCISLCVRVRVPYVCLAPRAPTSDKHTQATSETRLLVLHPHAILGTITRTIPISEYREEDWG